MMMHSVYATSAALVDMSALATSASGGFYPQQATGADAAAYYCQMPASDSMLQMQLSPTALGGQHSARDSANECVKNPPSSQSDGFFENKFEPSREPCADEIPWADLVFWLGDDATGSVDACSCSACWREWQRARIQRRRQRKWLYAPYGKLSSKIPVINLPRIEGVN